MKPITLHPLSALVGISIATLVLLGTSAQTIATRDRIVGYVPAEQWTHFALGDLGPNPNAFTVPLNRRLVITRLTGSFSNLAVNGVSAGSRLSAVSASTASAWADVGNTRVVLQPGDVLGGLPGFGFQVQVWGYLEPL